MQELRGVRHEIELRVSGSQPRRLQEKDKTKSEPTEKVHRTVAAEEVRSLSADYAEARDLRRQDGSFLLARAVLWVAQEGLIRGGGIGGGDGVSVTKRRCTHDCDDSQGDSNDSARDDGAKAAAIERVGFECHALNTSKRVSMPKGAPPPKHPTEDTLEEKLQRLYTSPKCQDLTNKARGR